MLLLFYFDSLRATYVSRQTQPRKRARYHDHYRPEPLANTYGAPLDGTGVAEFSSSMKDWYFMFRLGYFF